MAEKRNRQLAMTVTIDMDGNVIDVTDKDGNPVPSGWPEDRPRVRSKTKPIHLIPYAVYVHEKNPRCITYQTPAGPRTV